MTPTITETTFLLALGTFWMAFLAWRQLSINGRQLRLQYFGKPFEEALLLIADTHSGLQEWLTQLKESEEVNLELAWNEERSRRLSVDAALLDVKQTLYPNPRVTPLIKSWTLEFGKTTNELLKMYEGLPRNEQGQLVPNKEVRLEACRKLDSRLDTLSVWRMKMEEAMANEIAVDFSKESWFAKIRLQLKKPKWLKGKPSSS